MAFSLAPLLMHSESVSAKAREALRAASAAPAEQRNSALASAARVLYSETALDCDDALEIVGLQSDCGCD
jgi:plasmid stability protein